MEKNLGSARLLDSSVGEDDAGEPVVIARAVSRRYGKDFYAVKDFDLSVNRGEVFALLGTNGAGKTSVLEILEGLAHSASGEVTVFGHDPLRERAAIRPRQAIVIQSGGFPSDLTVRETLRMWGATVTNAMPAIRAMALVDLLDKADVRVKALSGGEVRRLDLACAMMGQPELLFLDEPTTGLDPESRRRTWQLIRRMRDDGATIILTTHYLEEADALCDRLAIMHRGRIIRQGTPAHVVADYPTVISCQCDAQIPTDLSTTLAVQSPRCVPAGAGGAASGNAQYLWHSHHPQKDLTALLSWAANQNITLRDIKVLPATLETVFLDIARDDGDENLTVALSQ